ncbi:MAG: hypothetical protein Q4G49_15770 [Paracoccus sp. (in: a-proteobacteria)]|nr:hypothetical protein [Paracoccus sp. (in: a-proteobacteria)]
MARPRKMTHEALIRWIVDHMPAEGQDLYGTRWIASDQTHLAERLPATGTRLLSFGVMMS